MSATIARFPTPSGRALDAVLAGATALVVVVAIVGDVGRDRPAPAVAYVFAVGFGALMMVRRPHPVLALVATSVGLLAYYALGFPPVGLALPVAAALYSAAEGGALRWAVGAGAVLVGVSSLVRTLEGEDPAYLFAFELPTTVAVMAATIALGDSARARRLWRGELSDRLLAERARAEAEASRRVEEHRLALARDVHDVVAHSLSIVTVHADVAAEALQDGDPTSASVAVTRIREAGRAAGRELRRSVRALRSPADPAAVGEAAAPEEPKPATELLSRVQRLTREHREVGSPVVLRVRGEPRPLKGDASDAIFRVVQESLSNVRRHSPQAPMVDVTLAFGERHLSVTVENSVYPGPRPGNQRPDADRGGAGLGLRGMRERVAALGGDVEVTRRADGGFMVAARLPAGEVP